MICGEIYKRLKRSCDAEADVRIIFLSNYFNHHQKDISNEFNKICSSYTFVSTSEMREERRELGYGISLLPKYVLKKDVVNKKKLDELIDKSDVVIIGSASKQLIKKRIREKKIIFRYSERPFKKQDQIIKYIPRLIKWHVENPCGRPIYMLCASAYTAYDYGRYALYKNKAYKWGYFPQTRQYHIDELLEAKKKASILWCGRFLDWKHPEDAIKVADRLNKEGYDFCLNFIGTGEMEAELKQMASQRGLSKVVSFLGSMPPERVRDYMEKAGVFLFTSDRQEGWGAVLNEAMNSGCAVVASHAIGAVPYLIQNNENGLVYRSGDVEILYRKVKFLLDHPEEQSRLGRAAYQTIVDTWNAEVAAERFVNLTQHILAGEKSPDLYETGPCSRAEIIKDDWFDE